jgi:GH18 family chitinase
MDSARSLQRKLEFAQASHFRGVFWWEFHCDYYPPEPGQTFVRHPLIDHVYGLLPGREDGLRASSFYSSEINAQRSTTNDQRDHVKHAPPRPHAGRV